MVTINTIITNSFTQSIPAVLDYKKTQSQTSLETGHDTRTAIPFEQKTTSSSLNHRKGFELTTLLHLCRRSCIRHEI